MSRRGLLLAVAFLASAIPLASRPTLSAPDPYQVLDKARAYWRSQNYPAYIHYIVRVTVTERGATRDERYESAYNNVTSQIWLNPVSDFEKSHPAHGGGIRFCLMQCPGGPQADPRTDFFGVPMLTPTYDFELAPLARSTPPSTPTPEELVTEIRREFHDPLPPGRSLPSPSPTDGIPEIATVTAYDRKYTVVYVGEEAINGHRCFHLSLTPVEDPSKYRLRQIWIDEASFATVRLVESANFTEGPGTEVPWVVDFRDVSGAHYIDEERSLGAIKYGGVRYSDVHISFEDEAPIPTLPAPTAVGAFLILREP